MDITLIQGTISGLKLAGDIAKSILELKSMSDVQSSVIELQSAILAAQSSALSANADQTAMVEEISTLKKEIADIKAWKEEKQRYQLVSPCIGSVAYALKKECSKSEPPHWICTNCYENGRKSILNQHKKSSGIVELVCQVCATKIEPPGRYSKGFAFEYAEKYI